MGIVGAVIICIFLGIFFEGPRAFVAFILCSFGGVIAIGGAIGVIINVFGIHSGGLLLSLEVFGAGLITLFLGMLIVFWMA